MTLRTDLSEAIGNTPLIRLNAASDATGCEILGKAEFMNPGQSVKDRAALYIIKDAVEKSLKGRPAIPGLGLRWSGHRWALRRLL